MYPRVTGFVSPPSILTTRPFSTVTSSVQASGQSSGQAVRMVECPKDSAAVVRAMGDYRSGAPDRQTPRDEWTRKRDPWCGMWDPKAGRGKESRERRILVSPFSFLLCISLDAEVSVILNAVDYEFAFSIRRQSRIRQRPYLFRLRREFADTPFPYSARHHRARWILLSSSTFVYPLGSSVLRRPQGRGCPPDVLAHHRHGRVSFCCHPWHLPPQRTAASRVPPTHCRDPGIRDPVPGIR